MKKFTLLFIYMLASTLISAQEWAPVGDKSGKNVKSSKRKNLPFRNVELPLDDRVYDLIDRLTLEEKMAWMNPYNQGIERLGISDFSFQYEALHGLAQRKATMFPQSIGLAATWDDELMLRIASAISTEARAKYNGNEGPILSFWSPNINLARDPRWGRNQETYGEDPHMISRMAVSFVKGIQGDDPNYLKSVACPKHFLVHNGPEKGKMFENRVVSEADLIESYLPAFEAVVKEAGAKGIMGAYNMLNWESCVTSKYYTNGLLREKWGFDGYVVTDCGALSSASTEQKRVATPEEAVALAVKSGIDLNCGSQFEKHMKTALEKGYMTERDIDNALYRTIKVKMQLGIFDTKGLCKYDEISPDKIQCDEHKALALEAARKSITLLKNDKTLPLDKKVKSIALIGPSVKNTHVLTGNYTGLPDKITSIYEGVKVKADEKGITVNYAKGSNIGDEAFMELVSDDVLTTPEGKPGLKGVFYYEVDFKKPVKELTVDKVDFAYEWKPIVEEQEWNPNSIKFKGYLNPKVSGDYLLSIEGAQGFGLIINNDTIAYRGRDREGRWQNYEVIKKNYYLKAGEKYKLEIFINKTQGKNDVHFYWKVPGVNPIKEALEAAKKSDVIIFAGGSSNEFEDEQNDREYLGFSETQLHLLSELKKTGKPIVMVLVNGSMTALDEELLKINSIVDVWFPGQAGGTAVADILFGDYNPAGRTAVTFYKSEEDLPDFRDFSMNNRTYKYFTGTPNFRFGHGLSYTNFKYSNLTIDDETTTNTNLEVSVDVKNTGKYDGDEVVQVYVHINGASMPAPISSLKAFKRVHIKKGKTKKISLVLNPEDFAHVNRKFEKIIKAGIIDIYVGNCSPEVKEGKAIASEKILIKTVKLKGEEIVL